MRLERDDAIIFATAVRMGAAEAKEEMRKGELSLGEALADPRTGAVRLETLICALPGYGLPRARRLLRTAGLALNAGQRRVDALTERERRGLVEAAG